MRRVVGVCMQYERRIAGRIPRRRFELFRGGGLAACHESASIPVFPAAARDGAGWTGRFASITSGCSFHAPSIACGRTQASNSAAVVKPSASAAARSVVPSAHAFFAICAARS